MAPSLPVHVERLQASVDDPDLATEQTIDRMVQHIRDCANDTVVIAAARKALDTFGAGGLGRRNAAWAVWWSVKHALMFVEDDQLLQGLTPNPPELELLVSPSVMVRSREPRGDCDDFTMLLCCFLEVLGCPWEIVTVAVDPQEPERWSHVYAVAVFEDGSRLALDASHGAHPGWEVPAEHVMRYQAWDRSGRAIARRPAAKGLHGYRPRGGFRGLGQCPDETGADPCAAVSTGWQTPGATVPVGTTYGPATPTGVVSSGSSFNWGSTITNLLNQWTAIGGKVIAPTTTYTVGPGGQVSLSTPSGSTAASSLLSGSTLGMSTGTIVLLVVGLGALLFLAKK